MKTNGIREKLSDVWGELTYGVRWLCKCPSPGKRLVTVLILCTVFGGLYVWFVISSIYSIGKRDAERDFMKLQHIESLKLQQGNDSIKTVKRMEFKKVEN